MSKPIAIYLRVSSGRQDTASQEPDLRAWAKANARGRKVRVYRETASGKTMDRPVWSRVEEAIRGGRISDLVVWRVDRLGRTASGLTALFELLRERGINFVSLRDGFDLSTPAGRMMANVLASVAEFENDLRSERVCAGQARARSEGKTWGGSERGKRIKSSPSKEQERVIVRLAKEGAPKAEIARAVGLTRPTIYKILNRAGLYEYRSESARKKFAVA